MKTYNLRYQKKKDLEKIIKEQKIEVSSDKILIQVFTGKREKLFIQRLQKTVGGLFPRASLIGATTSGEMIDNAILHKETIISISVFEETCLSSTLIVSKKGRTSHSLGMEIGKRLFQKDTRALITFSDGLNTNGEEYMNGVEHANNSVIVCGGMAGDNLEFKKTYIFDRNTITDNGAVAVALNNKNLQVYKTYSLNWKNIGKLLTITKVKGNRVYTIDDIPAVEIYRKYLGDEIAERLPNSGIQFPLIMTRDDMKTARAVLNKHEDGSLTFAGNVIEGEQVQLGYANVEMILNTSTHLYKELLALPIESLFIYSCCARWMFLNKDLYRELDPLSQIAPTSGFFTYGEFYHSNKNNKLLNETMTVVAFSEKKEIEKKDLKIDITDKDEHIITLNALSHLAQVVTEELTELTDHLEEKVLLQTEELRQSYEKLKKLDNEKDIFISIASHELRTPLTVLNGYLSLLLTENLSKKQQHIIERSQHNVQQLIAMVNDMLDLKKLESGHENIHIETVSLRDLLDEIQEDFGEHCRQCEVNLKIHFPKQYKGMVLADPVKLKQVFTNLLGNAIKFCVICPLEGSKKHEISIKVTSCAPDKKHIQISVKDDGVGIPESELGSVFDTFHQLTNHLKNKSSGSGLGLSICKKFIESFGGEIWVESEPRKGATFSFTLEKAI